MQGRHWFMLAAFFVAGYLVGQLWKQPAQMVGLAG